ncbi:AAA family ATPase, partial [Conexibacter stalactiti]
MEWPLVGRDRELEALGALLSDDSASAGVVIAGAAGVGKTRLAGELARLAQARGWPVQWARATRSAASIPLGAFAAFLPKPPADATPSEGAELLARVRHALVERTGGGRLLLCVEDGHWLDAASATLVHQLAATGEGFVVVTVRGGEPVPDALRALWKDELCELVELRELTRAEVDRLLIAALGGPVDGGTVNALWELTLGNALFLRELVLFGRDRGLLADRGGIWRWDGAITPGMRLGELVGARLAALSDAAARAFEVVAVGAPLELELLEAGERDELETLERQALTELRAERRRRVVDLAHPLHGEVVRARLSRTRLDAIQRRLADALEARGAHRRGDLPRVAAWRLESGAAHDPLLFERAARHALAALDVTLAERLARAAAQAGGGFDARLTLGQALAGAGRALEAEELLGALDAEADGAGARAAEPADAASDGARAAEPADAASDGS